MRQLKRKDVRNRTREAAALSYDPEAGAPRVVAAGSGHVAERIIETAEAHSIPVHEDPELAHTLNMLKVGQEIPPELYTVVAQVLVFVKDMDELIGRSG